MLSLTDISYAYDDFQVVNGVSLDVADGEILCLLGPSGCGKTTLLRVVTGLETGYQGQITLAGQDIRYVPVHERDFGLMFQDFALFPHLSVADNVAYGLRRKRKSKAHISQRIASLLGQVGLAGFENRDVNMLSGGQKQRVALARSLAPNPHLLMLDEPLGSLDALLRDQLIVELREMIKSIGLTAIYVTHDQKEAFSIADRVAVMNAGRIEQIDTPQQIYNAPETAFVARFLGLSNIMPIDDSEFVRHLMARSFHQFEHASQLLFDPKGILVQVDTPASTDDFYHATVQSVIFRGEYSLVTVTLAGDRVLRVNVLRGTFVVGQSVYVRILPEFILPL